MTEQIRIQRDNLEKMVQACIEAPNFENGKDVCRMSRSLYTDYLLQSTVRFHDDPVSDTLGLEPLFERATEALTRVYENIKGTPHETRTKDMRDYVKERSEGLKRLSSGGARAVQEFTVEVANF